jgi:uncharacterized protein YkwD
MEMRIIIRLAGVILVAVLAISAVRAQSGGTVAEQELFASVNRARRAQGLTALKWNDALAAAAHRHAALMAEHGAAEHGFAGEPSLGPRVTQAGVRFVWVAENVARGATLEMIHAEITKSPNHRANMLDSDMDSIGVGIVERDGELFAVEDFCKAK